ncbi:unnamed protein product [Pleuronectes platessa]|uniref:Uncharacterized protein n=1 Tax=Pleuronectes platessa TaxID=8262 RepID=A0A9N7VAA3_PLEPL|nr:unnamed protein product [Pleuronectes platessa]
MKTVRRKRRQSMHDTLVSRRWSRGSGFIFRDPHFALFLLQGKLLMTLPQLHWGSENPFYAVTMPDQGNKHGPDKWCHL